MVLLKYFTFYILAIDILLIFLFMTIDIGHPSLSFRCWDLEERAGGPGRTVTNFVQVKRQLPFSQKYNNTTTTQTKKPLHKRRHPNN